MRIQVSGKDLSAALAKAKTVMVTNPSMLAYTAVLLCAEENQLWLHASDGDTTVSLKLPLGKGDQVVVPGQILLPPDPLLKWLRAARVAGDLTLQADTPDTVVVSAPGASTGSYSFRTLQATFPSPKIPKIEQIVNVDFTGLGAGVDAVSRSAGATDDTTRDELVQLVSGDCGLRLHSTDKYRVTRVQLPRAGFGVDQKILLSRKTLTTIAKWGPTGVITDPNGKHIIFVFDSGFVRIRLSAESFPPADAILEAPAAYKTTVNVSELTQALSRLSAVSVEHQVVVLTITGTQLQLKVTAEHIGTGTEELVLSQEVKEPLRLGVNVGYLTDAFAALGSSEGVLEWTSPTTPIRISTQLPEQVWVVVMPVQLTD